MISSARRSGVTVFERTRGDAPWTASALAGEDTLLLPELGIEMPVADLYEQVALSASGDDEVAERSG